MKRLISLLLFAFGLNAQPVVVIRGARVVDGTGADAQVRTVVIRGGQIDAVGVDAAVPAGARVIEAAGQTLLPGLMDLHTHLSASAVSGLAGDWGKSLKAYLACGVTTVNDFATNGEMLAPMRQLLTSGAVPGPRVNMAVRLSTPAGHGTEAGWGDFMTLTVATPEQARARAKLALSYKPDVLKVFTDGWRYGTSPNLTSMNLETLAAIVEEAHAAGTKVFTHTVTLEGAKIAARAGVDVLAHGIGDADADAGLISIMKEKRTVYMPTLAVYEFKAAPAERLLGLLEPEARASLRGGARTEPVEKQVRWRHLITNVKRLHEAGIPIVVGTDAGMTGTFHGYSTLRELELLVEAGFTPMEAILAGTAGSAKALGIESGRGTIAPGKAADLVLVEGRPDERIGDIEGTRRVFVGGVEREPAEMEKAIQSKSMTALPVRTVGPLVDDMERAGGRTALGTFRVSSTDPGVDHSAMLMLPVVKSGNDHALLAVGQLDSREHPYVRVELPLTPGAVEPADVSAYSGVEFDVRGEAAARLLVFEYHVRGNDGYAGAFTVGAEWRKARVPFASLKRRAGDGAGLDLKDARSLVFEIGGPGGSPVWLELDNVRFY